MEDCRGAKPEQSFDWQSDAPTCPVCSGREWRPLLSPCDVRAERREAEAFVRARTEGNSEDPTDFTQDDDVFVLDCLRCGTLVRYPRPSAAQVRAEYGSEQYGEGALEEMAAINVEFFVHKCAQLACHLPPGSRLLEVGCFVGGFLRAAALYGWEAHGVDVGKETADFCRAHGLSVERADILDWEPSGKFRGAAVWNTFDQIPCPRDALARIRAALEPGGLLVVRVPNGEFKKRWIRRMGGRALAEQAVNNHLSFPYLVGYNAESLSRLLVECGFQGICARGDTMISTRTSRTKPWAVREEMSVKAGVQKLCDRIGRATGLLCHPWVDIVARKE